jgi:hypothetical protein
MVYRVILPTVGGILAGDTRRGGIEAILNAGTPAAGGVEAILMMAAAHPPNGERPYSMVAHL